MSWITLNRKSFFYQINTDQCEPPEDDLQCVPGKSRKYKVGDRADMQTSVKARFDNLGLCQTDDLNDADIFWGTDLSDVWTTPEHYTHVPAGITVSRGLELVPIIFLVNHGTFDKILQLYYIKPCR